MDQLIPVIRLEVWLLLAGLALVVVYQMLRGRINMKGLLEDKMTGGPGPGSV